MDDDFELSSGSSIQKSPDGKLLLFNVPPETFTLPPELGRGNEKLKVVDIFFANSCKCGTHGNTKIFVLEKEFIIVDCLKRKGFLWIKKPKDMEEFKKSLMK
jgi:hypothetical protein